MKNVPSQYGMVLDRIRRDLASAEDFAARMNANEDGWKVLTPMRPKMKDDGFQAYEDIKFLVELIDHMME